MKQKFCCLVGIIAIILIDQWTKMWVTSHLLLDQSLRVGPYFNLRLAHNTGAAFSLFRNADGTISTWALYFLISLALIISIALAWRLFIKRQPLSAMRALCFSLIMAGAVGNVIDRIRWHYVVDFLDFHLNTWHYATFNVADCAVVIGVMLLLFSPAKKVLSND